MTFEQAVNALAMTCPLTDEPVNAATLIETFKYDVIQAVERPGSWEGHTMRHVLLAHGFLNSD
jgi:hypothetical protein